MAKESGELVNIKIIIKKVKRHLNDSGVRLTIGKGIRHLFRKLYKKATYLIYRRDLSGQQFPEHCPDGFVLRVVENRESQVLRQIEDIEEWRPGRLQRVISRGCCVAAFDGPRMAGFDIVAFQEAFFPPINLKLRLRPDQAWLEQVTVLKSYRKRGLATALNFRVFAELQKRGIRLFYGGVLASDIPAIKAAERVGLRPIAEVQYLKILNREWRVWKKARHVDH